MHGLAEPVLFFYFSFPIKQSNNVLTELFHIFASWSLREDFNTSSSNAAFQPWTVIAGISMFRF